MEAVLRLAIPGRFCVPWDRIVRMCLILMMLGILCFSVHEYAKNLAEYPEGKTADFVEEQGIPKIAAADSLNGNVPGKLSSDSPAAFPAVTLSVNAENNTGNTVLSVGKNKADHKAPVISADDTENSVPVTGTDNTENLTPIIRTDDVQSLTPTIRTDDVESLTPAASNDDTGSLAPAVSNDDNSDAAGDEFESDDSAVSKDEIEIKAPAADDTDTQSPAIDGGTIAAGGDESNTETGTREFFGFLIDEEGYISGVTDHIDITDGILVIAWDSECIGIRSGALSGLAGCLDELYIPANICDIEPGALDDFSPWAYIEVAEDNSCYYSENGFLYTR